MNAKQYHVIFWSDQFGYSNTQVLCGRLNLFVRQFAVAKRQNKQHIFVIVIPLDNEWIFTEEYAL